MNKQRRKQIDEISAQLGSLKHNLECLRDEEQEVFENLPESFQNGEKGEAITGYVDSLDAALNSIDEAIEYCGEATNN